MGEIYPVAWIQNRLFPLARTGCSLGVRHKYLLGPKNRSVLYCTYHPPVRRTIKCAPKTVVCGTIGLRTRFILLGFTGFYWVLLDFSEFRESSRRLRGGGVRLWVQSPLSTGCTQRYPYKQGVSHHLSTCYHRTAQPKGFFFGDTCRPTKLHHIFSRNPNIVEPVRAATRSHVAPKSQRQESKPPESSISHVEAMCSRQVMRRRNPGFRAQIEALKSP